MGVNYFKNISQVLLSIPIQTSWHKRTKILLCKITRAFHLVGLAIWCQSASSPMKSLCHPYHELLWLSIVLVYYCFKKRMASSQNLFHCVQHAGLSNNNDSFLTKEFGKSTFLDHNIFFILEAQTWFSE